MLRFSQVLYFLPFNPWLQENIFSACCFQNISGAVVVFPFTYQVLLLRVTPFIQQLVSINIKFFFFFDCKLCLLVFELFDKLNNGKFSENRNLTWVGISPHLLCSTCFLERWYRPIILLCNTYLLGNLYFCFSHNLSQTTTNPLTRWMERATLNG